MSMPGANPGKGIPQKAVNKMKGEEENEKEIKQASVVLINNGKHFSVHCLLVHSLRFH